MLLKPQSFSARKISYWETGYDYWIAYNSSTGFSFFSGTDAIVFQSINHLSILKLFVLQVCAQKTWGRYRSLMDYIICRHQMSSLYVIQVECSILRINHLFQNGRALLKCRIFILLQHNTYNTRMKSTMNSPPSRPPPPPCLIYGRKKCVLFQNVLILAS